MPIFIAPAKLNLYLRIAGRRPDGYHEIETLFQRIDLADELEVEKTTHGAGLELSVGGISLDCAASADNLVARAHATLASRLTQGVRVRLDKRVPPGGGLGGGSSDAAAMLRALDSLFDLRLDDATLARLALDIGADVPFFLQPGAAAIGRGVGERLTPVALSPAAAGFHAVLAFPGFGVSTAEVYGQYARQGPALDAPRDGVEAAVEALAHGNVEKILDASWNDMERLAFALRPELGRLRERLENHAGRSVRMSGSGSTLYTLTATSGEATDISRLWRQRERLQVETARLQTENSPE